MSSPKASLVKGGGFAVGKIGGIIENTYVSTYLNPSVSLRSTAPFTREPSVRLINIRKHLFY